MTLDIALSVALPVLFGLGFLAGARRRRHPVAPPGDGDPDSSWFEISNDLLVEASLDGYFTRLSKSWEAVTGWTRQELMTRPFRELVHPDDLAGTNLHADALDEHPGDVFNFENRYRTKDGSYRWLLWCAVSDHTRKYAVARDITERKLAELERQAHLEAVEAMARTDALTGLPNRRAWDEELDRSIAQARRHRRPLALALADLDDFKGYNDSRGHAAGDALLAEAAKTWRAALRADDFVARYGGEEFAVLLPSCRLEEAAVLLDRLRMATPEAETCSIGVAELGPGETGADLVARADQALYDAKRSGRNRVLVAGARLRPAFPEPLRS